MNGFDFKPAGNPFQMLTPEMLKQAASTAFRPPQPVTMSGLNLHPSLPPMPQPAPGFGLRDAMTAASAVLRALGGIKPTSVIYNMNALTPDASSVWQQQKMPTDIADGQGGVGAPDFLTGVRRNLFG